MQEMMQYLQSFDEIAVAIRLVIATLFGSLIGLERITKRHSAGIKTFSLVFIFIDFIKHVSPGDKILRFIIQ